MPDRKPADFFSLFLSFFLCERIPQLLSDVDYLDGSSLDVSSIGPQRQKDRIILSECVQPGDQRITLVTVVFKDNAKIHGAEK